MTQIEAPRTGSIVSHTPQKSFADPAESALFEAERRRVAMRRRHRAALYRASTRRRVASAVVVGALVIVGASVADAAIQRSVARSTAVSTNVVTSSRSSSPATVNAMYLQLLAQLNADSRALTQLEKSTRATLTVVSASGPGTTVRQGSTGIVAPPPTITPSAPVAVAPATHATTGASGGG
ncbi:MAG: hypothetical protein HKL85_07710 [Acidimicrobiaceae bacterium]|nr:hypothetical protein [Acidimicrobiaceae bacterium]